MKNKITFIGDSVGGTLIASLTQRLIIKDIQLPEKIILVTPVMDASMSNPDIVKVDNIDPMLSKIGVLSAKKMCAENNDLKNVMISPLLGLLGTVAGMIETFDSLAAMALFTQSGGIAGGVAQALLTTQTGLTVAIPGVLIQNILQKKQMNIQNNLAQIKDLLCSQQLSRNL